MSNNLMIDELVKTYEMLRSLPPTKIYYVLSNHLADKNSIYKMANKEVDEILIFHPSMFGWIKFNAELYGYTLIEASDKLLKVTI